MKSALLLHRTRSLLLAAAGLLLLAALLSVWAWERGLIQPWLQAQVVRFYLQKIQPGLPFRIESAQVDAQWSDFRQGKLTRLELSLLWDSWRAKLSGPIEIARDPQSGAVGIQYLAMARIEPSLRPKDVSPEFHLNLSVKLDSSLTQLSELSAIAQAETLKWDFAGVDAKNLYLGVDWRDGQAAIEATAQDLGWTSPSASDRAFQIKGLSASAHAPFQLKPYSAGPEIAVALKLDNAELLWGDTYLDLPAGKLPLQGKLVTNGRKITAAALSVGASEKIALQARFADAIELEWKARAISIPELLEGVTKATASSGGGGPLAQIGKLNQFHLRRGKMTSSGKAIFQLENLKSPKLDLQLALEGVDFDWPEKRLALRGVDLHLPYSTARGASGELSISKILLRKLAGSLGRTPFSYDPAGRLKIGDAKALPLAFKALPLKVEPLTGKADSSRFELTTGASLPPTDAHALAASLCIDPRLVPAASVHAEFPKISITDEAIDPEGQIELKAFEGSLVLSDLGYFDYLTEAPQLDFSAELSGMQLGQLGRWLHFGKMDGLLEGHARDVVVEGSIPIQYDFLLQAKPQKSKNVVFSSRAMKNVVRLVGGTDLESQIPGAANNIMFGWVSRLLGGYNVRYAGLSLFSRGGSIMLETLDPPDILQKENGRHFILYGPRFKMPVQSSRYPVIMDATSMGGYVRYFTHELAQISATPDEDADGAANPANPNEEKRDETDLSDPLCDPTRR